MNASPFRVMFVCTGNICRSPQAERLLRARLLEAGFDAETVVTSSAGTRAMLRAPMDAKALRETLRHGAAEAPHSARDVTAELIEHHDLVLTLERSHRALVVQQVPSATRHAFTLVEFERLLTDAFESGAFTPSDGSPADQMRATVRQAHERRGLALLPEDPDLDDIEDPYKRSGRVYKRSAERVAEATASVARLLTRAVNPRHV